MSPVFLPDAPSSSSCVRTTAVTAARAILTSCLLSPSSVPFPGWSRGTDVPPYDGLFCGLPRMPGNFPLDPARGQFHLASVPAPYWAVAVIWKWFDSSCSGFFFFFPQHHSVRPLYVTNFSSKSWEQELFLDPCGHEQCSLESFPRSLSDLR